MAALILTELRECKRSKLISDISYYIFFSSIISFFLLHSQKTRELRSGFYPHRLTTQEKIW